MTYEQKATGKGMTIGEIKDFIAKAEMLGATSQTLVKGEVTVGGGKLKSLKVVVDETADH